MAKKIIVLCQLNGSQCLTHDLYNIHWIYPAP